MRVPTQGPSVRTTDGITLATWDLGGDGPPLLFLHATGFHGRCWTPLATELSATFHCWALDQRGHGDSDRSPGLDYSWHLFGDDVRSSISTLELDRPFVVGHSLGGGVALMVEALQPATFSGLYLYEPVVISPDPGPPPPRPTGDTATPGGGLLANLARRRRQNFDSKAAAIDNYIRKPPFRLFRSDVLAAYVDGGFRDLPDGGVTLSCDNESEARVFEAAPYSGIAGVLVPTQTPTYLAYGDQDQLISDHEAIARALGGATLEVFPFLGHLGPFEDPGRLARAIEGAFAASGGAHRSGWVPGSVPPAR